MSQMFRALAMRADVIVAPHRFKFGAHLAGFVNQGLDARSSSGPRRQSTRLAPDHDRRAPYRQRESSLSQGAKWKVLINTYIGTIPVSGDPSRAAEQSISGMLSLWTAASSAMLAKVGVAARDSKQAALAVVRFLRPRAMSESTKSIMSEIISVHLHCVLLQS